MIEYLKGVQRRYLTDVCTVLRPTRTANGYGTAESWAAVLTDVPCRVDVHSTSVTEGMGSGGAVRSISEWRIHVPAGTAVKVTDRIAYGDRTFEVNRVDAKSPNVETVRNLICRELV